MDKKEILKRKRKRNRIIKTFVLVIAFVVAIGTTFGVTMAYFGGTSNTLDYDMTLKTGVYINAPTPTGITQNAYVVPSQILDANCQVKVKSAKPENGGLTTTTGNAASKGLLRAVITFDAGGTGATLTSAGKAYFPVKIGENVVANLVQFPTTAKFADEKGNEIQGDGYYYLMAGTTLDADALMYEVDTTSGEVTLDFDLKITIPDSLTNADGGKPISLTIQYQVIQSDFYSDSTTPVAKTAANAKAIFDVVDDNATGY